MIFLKCKIRFIYVGFNCKRKKWGKKMSGNFAIKGGGEGGVGRLMANAILNFHFDYLNPSLSQVLTNNAMGRLGGQESRQPRPAVLPRSSPVSQLYNCPF